MHAGDAAPADPSPTLGADHGPPSSSDAPESGPPPKPGFKLEELGVFGTILAAVGGGLGVLGFVAFFGAAILWVRMDEVGLPGNTAVAVVPKSVLISTGGSFLVPALLIAIGFTLLLYMIDAAAVFISESRVRGQKGRLRDAQRKARRLRREAENRSAVAADAAQNVTKAQAAVEMQLAPPSTKVEAEEQRKNIVRKDAEASRRAIEAEKEAFDLEAELKKTEPRRRERNERLRTGILILGTVLLFAIGTILVLNHYSVHRSPERWAVLFLVASTLITLCVVVRLRTGSFGWFAVAAFIGVGLMVGTLTYYRTVDDPKVEPAALLRTKGPPAFGFFVTQTSDRVYLGTRPKAGPVRLDAIPREEIVELVVGTFERPTRAEARAIGFARHLCLRSRQRTATGRVTGKDGGGKVAEEFAHGCTAGDLRRLEVASRGWR